MATTRSRSSRRNAKNHRGDLFPKTNAFPPWKSNVTQANGPDDAAEPAHHDPTLADEPMHNRLTKWRKVQVRPLRGKMRLHVDKESNWGYWEGESQPNLVGRESKEKTSRLQWGGRVAESTPNRKKCPRRWMVIKHSSTLVGFLQNMHQPLVRS